jgi:hypothetical protein
MALDLVAERVGHDLRGYRRGDLLLGGPQDKVLIELCDQVLVQGFLARGRRSSSLMPPHTPWSCLVPSAKARHCRRTGQPAQMAFASVT